jgi:RimJ/RimL family protein N-acetyltransferase
MRDEAVLRDVVVDDIPVFYEHQLDQVASRLAGFPVRSWDAHASHWARILDDATIVAQTVVVDGHVAGNVVSFVQNDACEVGYWLGREFWGRGIATQALAAFLVIEPRRPLHAYVARQNAASRRVLEKCGFTLAGQEPDGFRLVLRA